MKATQKLALLCMAIYVLAVTASAQTTWKLSSNLLEANNQISFNQGANGVWYRVRAKVVSGIHRGDFAVGGEHDYRNASECASTAADPIPS